MLHDPENEAGRLEALRSASLQASTDGQDAWAIIGTLNFAISVDEATTNLALSLLDVMTDRWDNAPNERSR